SRRVGGGRWHRHCSCAGLEGRKRSVNKRQTVVLLRWVLIIACSYLLILDAGTNRTPVHLVLLIVVALASNLVVARIPQRWAERQVFDFGVVVFDAAWVTLG